MEDTSEKRYSTKSEKDARLKEELAQILDELKALELSWPQAAAATGYNPGSFRNAQSTQKVPSEEMIKTLRLYLSFQKQIQRHFQKLSTDGKLTMNQSVDEYITPQKIWTELKSLEAYIRAYIERQIGKEVNGDENLKAEILEQFSQAAILASAIMPASSAPTVPIEKPEEEKDGEEKKKPKRQRGKPGKNGASSPDSSQ